MAVDHVHMCISIPPKYAVSEVIGSLKGKSAISVARQFGGKKRKKEAFRLNLALKAFGAYNRQATLFEGAL